MVRSSSVKNPDMTPCNSELLRPESATYLFISTRDKACRWFIKIKLQQATEGGPGGNGK